MSEYEPKAIAPNVKKMKNPELVSIGDRKQSP
jgi:hypothetical protein